MPCWPAKWLDVNAPSRPVGHAACGSGVMDDRRTSAGGSQVYSDRFLRLSVCLFLRVYSLLPSCIAVQFSSVQFEVWHLFVFLHRFSSRVWYPAPSISCQLVCFKSNRVTSPCASLPSPSRCPGYPLCFSSPQSSRRPTHQVSSFVKRKHVEAFRGSSSAAAASHPTSAVLRALRACP